MAAWLAALILVTVAVRVSDPTGWLGSDDASYHAAAEHILSGQTIERVHHHYARMVIILPVAASMWLFGDSPTSVALPTLVASILCVVLVAVLGRLIWGWWEGLCGATLVSVLPFFRVLSTVAYPDMHACFWATLAITFAAAAAQVKRVPWASTFALLSGLALGSAMSAKIFAATAVVGVVAVAWTRLDGSRRDRLLWLSWVALGGLIFLLLHGLFYLWAADDFWFKLHALLSAQGKDGLFPASGDPNVIGYATLAWKRLSLLLRPSSSGWGFAAVAFWPAAFLVLLCDRRGRGLALWAIATFLLIALMPVSLKNGPRPYPTFLGRNILIACVPFALCLAWVVRQAAGRIVHVGWLQSGWPIVLAAIVGLSYANPREVNWFRDRTTSRLALAIEHLIVSTDWDDHREIYMTPSMYWRFRILFPASLRARLRTAVDEDAPSWWRYTTVDSVARNQLLPSPDEAYLLATPTQLGGQPERWDYRVGLPRDALGAWQHTPPLITISHLEGKTISSVKGPGNEGECLVLLLASGVSVTEGSKKMPHDPDIG